MIQASRLELHIGELLLHGVAPRDQAAFTQAFTFELTRLLSEQGFPDALGSTGESNLQVDSLDAGVLQASPGLSPGHLGTRAAQAVYAGMGGAEP